MLDVARFSCLTDKQLVKLPFQYKLAEFDDTVVLHLNSRLCLDVVSDLMHAIFTQVLLYQAQHFRISVTGLACAHRHIILLVGTGQYLIGAWLYLET